MRTEKELKKLATEYVDCYIDEFGMDDPDWKSEWWRAGDNLDDWEFDKFMEECGKVWEKKAGLKG
jgi:hypothetical protein